jgi:hypothetical protein
MKNFLKDLPGFAILWAILGTFTVALYVVVEGKTRLEWPEYIGVMLLWPLFIIKFAALAVYSILSAGFGALV